MTEELAKFFGLLFGYALQVAGPTLARAIVEAWQKPNTITDAVSNPGVEDAFVQAALSDAHRTPAP